ncbi:MAG: LysM peptidoglycan-binding domain-containing protein [Chloroflexota bacterium]|nr:LysM peptidoglycan-binding domain-containing protein [Chloroflexota bacterium]
MKIHALFGLLLLLVLLVSAFPAIAAPPLQPTTFPTPTPGPDGRIIYTVQQGDSLWRIAAVTDMSIDKLRALNNLTADDTIAPGDEIFLGLGGPSAPEPAAQPSVTPTPVGPTPTPEIGYGTICVIVYEDVNGDAVRQEEEASLPKGAISITNADGSVSITTDTLGGYEHFCTDEAGEILEEGQYNVSVAIPEGYNPTMELSASVVLDAGKRAYLDFGAQPNSNTIANAPAPLGTGKSPLLGIAGGIILLTGIGVGVYMALVKQK